MSAAGVAGEYPCDSACHVLESLVISRTQVSSERREIRRIEREVTTMGEQRM